MAGYDTLPTSAKTQPSKFTVSVDEDKLSRFKQLLSLSSVGPETYENLQDDRRFGLSRKWLADTKQYWEKEYDWRTSEIYINSFPNYMIRITDDDTGAFDIHFIALFSKKQDAIPITLLHGWPGSFIEFLQILDILKKRHTPDDLPYHVIVPSLPGSAFSSGPPLDKDWTDEDTARIIHKLMIELGFGTGYVAQGGDIGSFIARTMAAKYEACRALHLNFCDMTQPEGISNDSLDVSEKRFLEQNQAFYAKGRGYAIEHGTRPATIGLVLSSSPIALLCWIGEKFLEWTDSDPPLNTILESVTLYWLTDTFPRSIHTYRQAYGTGNLHPRRAHNKFYCSKPLGYSLFPKEITPVPKTWVASTGDLVFYREHGSGGHFAALEKPDELLADIEDFVTNVWKK